MASDLTECLKCGAMVDNTVKHKRWHEALERVLPGLEAEVQRLRAERKDGPARPLSVPNRDPGIGGF